MMKKQTKQNKLSKLGKLLLIVVLCVTTFYQSSHTAATCDWPLSFGNSSRNFSIPYYCSPGLHFSVSWKNRLVSNDDQKIVAVRNDRLFYTDEDWIYVADINTGEIIKFINDKKYFSGITTVIGDKLIVEALVQKDREKICALNVDTFETEWMYEYPLCKMRYIPNGNDDYVLLTFCQDALVCLDLSTGEEVWILEGAKSLPVIQDNKFVVLFDDSLRCYSIDKLEMIWSKNISEFDHRMAECVINGDGVYGLSVDRSDAFNRKIILYAMDVNNGKMLWFSEEYVTHVLGGTALSANTKNVFLIVQNNMYCFDKYTGEKLWTYALDEYDIMNNMVSTEKTVYYTDSYGVHTIDAKNGKKVSTSVSEENLCCGSVSYSNRRLLFNRSGYFLCFDGTAKARYKIDTDGFKVNDNEYKADISPLIKNNRTLLSVRYVIDPLGGDITWEPDKQKVTCSLLVPRSQTDDLTQKNTVELWIGKPTAKINGIEVQIDPNNPEVVPVIIDGRTMIPMRFLAESLGCSVEWIAESKEIILTYTP